MSPLDPTPDLIRRLRDGLDRIATALRSDHWSAAEAAGLVPTQAHILTLLATRTGSGLRVKEIAGHLGVSQPTATDSITALMRKGLVAKQAAVGDARAIAVLLTPAGQTAAQALGFSAMATDAALGMLDVDEQRLLLRLLVKVIRGLQANGSIPMQRMCVTCRYFRPHVHADRSAPHHCDFVNAAFGDAALRLDCGDHEAAPPSDQAATWRTFSNGAVHSEQQS
jgi:DNA-binding MarR family transcriptional regulator